MYVINKFNWLLAAWYPQRTYGFQILVVITKDPNTHSIDNGVADTSHIEHKVPLQLITP